MASQLLAPTRIEIYAASEFHAYDDERGDTGPDWGVYHVTCAACEIPLHVVAKVDVPWSSFCHHCRECAE